jgi:hypothetical protein
MKTPDQSTSPIDILLNRLEFVRPAGDSYRARCPVHQGKSRDSLKITLCDDGRILLHCFSEQCSPMEIVNVCGLEIGDLFPKRITHHATPQERRKWSEAATHQEWKDSCKKVLQEARVVWVAGKQIRDGKPLNDTDDNRLDVALEQISTEGRKMKCR